MANSAIRIPIPGSIIDAASAVDGDLLYFDSTIGNGGSFVNFKPLIQDIRPFTKNSTLDFYVSVKNQAETSSWESATAKAMTLAAGLNAEGLPVETDMRLGVNLSVGRPSHNLEVVGDIMVWGNGLEGGDILGRINYYSNDTATPSASFSNLIFSTPLKAHTDPELDAVQSSLRTGRLLVKHPTSKATYFARLEDILSPGNGISVTDNTVSIGSIDSIESATGFTIRLDTNESGGESEAFRVVESVTLPNGQASDFSLLKVVRQHKAVVEWNAGAFQIGDEVSQAWPAVKMAVGTGSRFLPSGFLVEDGAPVTADDTDIATLDQEGYTSISAGGSVYARLFGPVAANPADIILTGPAGLPNQAIYFDSALQSSATATEGNGRFGFLPGIGTMWASNGYANPGSFVAGFLNKHGDGGGIKVKSGDINNDEFSLFLENGDLFYSTSQTTGTANELTARQFTIAENPSNGAPNEQYQNIVAANAPVFTVRATTGDTFVRGFLVMPFLPGINSDVDGTDASPVGNAGAGVSDGVTIYSTHVNASGVVSIRRYAWSTAGNAWVGPSATFTLPKGTVYCDASGNVKIARQGSHIPNHGLNGVSTWRVSD